MFGGGGCGTVQRLKQNNLGARLRLNSDEFLVAQGPAFPNRGTVRRVRLRVESSGFAERSYHEIAPAFSVFSHCSAQLDRDRLSVLGDALQAARDELSGAGARPDSRGLLRAGGVWEDGPAGRVGAGV